MKQIKPILVSVVLTLVACFGMFAQNQRTSVSGVVKDSAGIPVVGAVVMVSGTNNATVTEADGGYTLRVPAGEVSLEVSCLGYVTQTIQVPAAQGSLNVTLQEDNMMLEETVVVGYGVQKKVNLTGAVTAVDAKELEDRTTHSLTNMLQGAVPGLNISTSAGNPGSAGSLNIRGITSINEADPLVLIDGTEGDLSRVNPSDVANISVIKDAAAAAITAPALPMALSSSPPNPVMTRAARPRFVTADASAGKSLPFPPTLKPAVTGRFTRWISSGPATPARTAPTTRPTTWPNFSLA